MKLRHYEIICIFICILLGYEYLVLNQLIVSPSLIKMILPYTNRPKFDLNPRPGYPLSYLLGWLGFGIMLLTNLYILKKRLPLFKGQGKMSGWLDFHIFCGMLGPILIIFHSNFKVEGLVAISFWSMIISSSSGIFGRYFYIQTLKKREEIKKYLEKTKNAFEERYNQRLTRSQLENVFNEVTAMAGVVEGQSNPILVLKNSIIGDINLMFKPIGENLSLNKNDVSILKKFGIEKRRLIYIYPFNRLLGYWHSFHLPFAAFMYIVAVIHIAAALLFGVKH